MKEVDAAVIPVAGLGTRMLPMTKALPKELLPLPAKYRDNTVLIPILHLIFLKLYEAGIRKYILVISRNKESIKNYFSIDYDYLTFLRSKGNRELETEILEEFYNLLEDIDLITIYQEEPRGFGDAVFRAKNYIDGNFIIHPGDDYIIDIGDTNYILDLYRFWRKFNADISFYVEEVEDPRHYGVITGYEITDGIYHVSDLMEKPDIPPTNLAITAIYIATKDLLDEMEMIDKEKRGWELIDAVKNLLMRNYKVIAIKIDNELRIDVGRPVEYIKSIEKSGRYPIIIK